MRPAASEPMDNPQVLTVTYQESTSARLVGVVSCDMIDLAMLSADLHIHSRVLADNTLQ
jgi:hypothetical protein